MEVPPGSNRGPKVDIYVSTTGLDPAGQFAWCACFVYWCFDKAVKVAWHSESHSERGTAC